MSENGVTKRGQKVREHRCGGQLVKGKKCASFEFIRGFTTSQLFSDALPFFWVSIGSASLIIFFWEKRANPFQIWEVVVVCGIGSTRWNVPFAIEPTCARVLQTFKLHLT